MGYVRPYPSSGYRYGPFMGGNTMYTLGDSSAPLPQFKKTLSAAIDVANALTGDSFPAGWVRQTISDVLAFAQAVLMQLQSYGQSDIFPAEAVGAGSATDALVVLAQQLTASMQTMTPYINQLAGTKDSDTVTVTGFVQALRNLLYTIDDVDTQVRNYASSKPSLFFESIAPIMDAELTFYNTISAFGAAVGAVASVSAGVARGVATAISSSSFWAVAGLVTVGILWLGHSSPKGAR